MCDVCVFSTRASIFFLKGRDKTRALLFVANRFFQNLLDKQGAHILRLRADLLRSPHCDAAVRGFQKEHAPCLLMLKALENSSAVSVLALMES